MDILLVIGIPHTPYSDFNIVTMTLKAFYRDRPQCALLQKEEEKIKQKCLLEGKTICIIIYRDIKANTMTVISWKKLEFNMSKECSSSRCLESCISNVLQSDCQAKAILSIIILAITF